MSIHDGCPIVRKKPLILSTILQSFGLIVSLELLHDGQRKEFLEIASDFADPCSPNSLPQLKHIIIANLCKKKTDLRLNTSIQSFIPAQRIRKGSSKLITSFEGNQEPPVGIEQAISHWPLREVLMKICFHHLDIA